MNNLFLKITIRTIYCCFLIQGSPIIAAPVLAVSADLDSISAKMKAKLEDAKTSRTNKLYQIEYDAEFISYFEPLKVSASKTTAVIEIPNVRITNPLTGKTSHQTAITSYSIALKKAYRKKNIHLRGTFLARKKMIVKKTTSSITSISGVTLNEVKTLYLAFDGNNSKALLKSKNLQTNDISYQGLMEVGDKIEYFIYNPIRSYVILLDFKTATLEQETSDTIILSGGERRYTLSKIFGYSVISHTAKRGNENTIVTYKDYKKTKDGIFFPHLIEEKRINDMGELIHTRRINFTTISFSSPHTSAQYFNLKFPPNTKISENSMLQGLFNAM